MTPQIYQIQIALFFTTPFNKENKLEFAKKIISFSDGLFREEFVSTPQIPDYVTGPIWLNVTNPTNGFSFQVSDKKIDIIWDKISQEDTKNENEFLNDISKFLSSELFEKPTIKRWGFIRRYLFSDSQDTFKKSLFQNKISSFDDFTLTLVGKSKLSDIDFNSRYEIASVSYSTIENPDVKNAGVSLTSDINTSDSDDLDLSVGGLYEAFNAALEVYTANKLLEDIGISNDKVR